MIKSIIINKRIKKELKEFKNFKSNYKFTQKTLEENKNGDILCEGDLVKKKDEKEVGFCDAWVNVGYQLHGPFSKALSNLFQYEFIFKNKKVKSIESIFQGIKIKDKKIQNKAFNYFGMDSNTIKIANDFDWKKEGVVYWQGKAISRMSKEFDNFIDELYISALQNPLYRNVLKNIKFPYILHSIGGEKKEETVFTRYEFEFMLNCLKDFVQSK